MTPSSTTHSSTGSDLGVVLALARLFERLEQRPLAVTPEQYRLVAQRLQLALSRAEPGDALEAVLAACPSAAEVYENLQYEHAGLCRAPLEMSLNAELQARAGIRKAAGA